MTIKAEVAPRCARTHGLLFILMHHITAIGLYWNKRSDRFQATQCIPGWLSLMVGRHQDVPGTSLQYKFDCPKKKARFLSHEIISKYMSSELYTQSGMSRSIPPWPPRNGVGTTSEKATNHIGDRLSDLPLMCLGMLHVK